MRKHQAIELERRASSHALTRSMSRLAIWQKSSVAKSATKALRAAES